jgi:hypothetical protein
MKCLKPLRPIGPLNRPPLGVIFCRNARFGQGVEQGGLAYVGQAHDAAFQTHGDSLLLLAGIVPRGMYGAQPTPLRGTVRKRARGLCHDET